jgi:predicted glycoside hydrolase/deacetylase ChbG (UPF0249 family)
MVNQELMDNAGLKYASAAGLEKTSSTASRTQGAKASTGMLIINADDWGGWKTATDAAQICHAHGRITSASAMVFMEDSERAAELAKETGLDVGLHINLNQKLSGPNVPLRLAEYQGRTRGFLKKSKYAQLIYHPLLRKQFEYIFQAQADEFRRLYGKQPSHYDGHQHMHLCSNMLRGNVIPAGQKIRRSFSFWPGEKGRLNRFYRSLRDRRIARRYVLTDYFFALSQCLAGARFSRAIKLAAQANVELMTHPEKSDEFRFLMSEEFANAAAEVRTGTYTDLAARVGGRV